MYMSNNKNTKKQVPPEMEKLDASHRPVNLTPPPPQGKTDTEDGGSKNDDSGENNDSDK